MKKIILSLIALSAIAVSSCQPTTAKAVAVVVGLSLRCMVNLTIRCPQRGKSNPAILTAAPFRGLPQR